MFFDDNADSDCKQKPDLTPPSGEHWYYHVGDNGAPCWHLRPWARPALARGVHPIAKRKTLEAARRKAADPPPAAKDQSPAQADGPPAWVLPYALTNKDLEQPAGQATPIAPTFLQRWGDNHAAVEKSDDHTAVEKSDDRTAIAKSDDHTAVANSDNQTAIGKSDNQTAVENSNVNKPSTAHPAATTKAPESPPPKVELANLPHRQPWNPKRFGILILSAVFAAALIFILAALLRRRKYLQTLPGNELEGAVYCPPVEVKLTPEIAKEDTFSGTGSEGGKRKYRQPDGSSDPMALFVPPKYRDQLKTKKALSTPGTAEFDVTLTDLLRRLGKSGVTQ